MVLPRAEVDLEVEAVVAVGDRDEAVLRENRYAKQSVIAGAIGVLLAPVVIGFIPAAIGLHAGISHMRFRVGARVMAAVGLALSGVAAIASILTSLLWGAALLGVLLQRSAIDQARQWEGMKPEAWTLVDTTGTRHESAASQGKLVYIDLCSPQARYSPDATRRIAEFQRAHPNVLALSWCPECSESDGAEYLARTESTLPLAVGLQSMPEPLSLAGAKPMLFVLDGEGRIRKAHPGLVTVEELAALMTAPTPEEPTLMRRGGSSASGT